MILDKRIYCRVTNDLLDRLKIIADKKSLDVSTLARIIILDYVNKEDEKNG